MPKNNKEKLDYNGLIQKYPWIIEKKQRCIISPDANGILSGLLMARYLNWKIVGFYDGKNFRIKQEISPKNCVFLDVEVLREGVRSVGHHILIHNINQPPSNYRKVIKNCINPNCIRCFDRCHHFSRKYPLGTVHLLLFILSSRFPDKVQIKKDGFGPIFFADGIWKILFKYTKNFLDWFQFLETERESKWWQKMKELPVIDLIKEIEGLFADLQKIHPENKAWYGHIFRETKLDDTQQRELLFNLVALFGRKTGWGYEPNNWAIDKLTTKTFSKKIFNKDGKNESFLKIWSQRPLSLAMTRDKDIEYTLEGPDKFL